MAKALLAIIGAGVLVLAMATGGIFMAVWLLL
jgi:hypothetical protein